MENSRKTKEGFITILILAVLSGIFSGFIAEAMAQHGGPHGSHREFVDSRYGHGRHYPMRGEYFGELPRDHRAFVYHGNRYFFSGGIWYRPEGPRFVVVAPPFGLVIPFLPPFYTTVWIGSSPYYYANEVYYAPAPGGYMVVAPPPQGTVSQIPPGAVPPPPPVGQSPDQMFIYPRKGQTEAQQAKDRYECHRWAVSQTGFDPTNPAAYPAGDQKSADYKRAMGACLEGRGYTVK